MNILVANDDGIKAKGIAELTKALSAAGNVYVCAPDSQRSASSHALSVNNDITMTKTALDGATMAFAIGGTPADCVKLGLYVLKKMGIDIDIVYSGINHGGNLGTDTMYSGTVSAAAEGLFSGLPAVAVSVNDHHPRFFEGACRLATDILPKALESGGKLGVISINTPDVPMEEIRGVKIAKLGAVGYHEWFDAVAEEGDKITYRYSGTPKELECWTAETDARLARDGYATISSVKYDQNDTEGNDIIEKWGIRI